MKFKILNIDVQHYKSRNRTIGVIWLSNDENIFIDSGLNQMTLRNTFDDIRELTPKEKKVIQEIIKDNLQIIEF